jgi:hypothetical protein
LTLKNKREMSLFGRKTGVRAKNKRHFILSFSGFCGYVALQAIDFHQLAWRRPLQKKSCLKTYGRFLVFWEIRHNRRVNIVKVQRKTVLAARVSKPVAPWNSTPQTPSQSHGGRLEPGFHPASNRPESKPIRPNPT